MPMCVCQESHIQCVYSLSEETINGGRNRFLTHPGTQGPCSNFSIRQVKSSHFKDFFVRSSTYRYSACALVCPVS